jgi:hypothetical protein
MKTLINHVVSTHQHARLTLLNWSDETVTSQLVRPPSWPTIVRRGKVPALRIMAPAKEDLFKYATAANARSGFWETVVFTVLGVSAVGALAMALLGV